MDPRSLSREQIMFNLTNYTFGFLVYHAAEWISMPKN